MLELFSFWKMPARMGFSTLSGIGAGSGTGSAAKARSAASAASASATQVTPLSRSFAASAALPHAKTRPPRARNAFVRPALSA